MYTYVGQRCCHRDPWQAGSDDSNARRLDGKRAGFVWPLRCWRDVGRAWLPATETGGTGNVLGNVDEPTRGWARSAESRSAKPSK